VNGLKKKGKKIVFTNGCFDILHIGHISLLEKAKEYGDVLVLGLNTDDSIKRLKGPSRPIINQQERIKILSALEYVNYIVLFDENNPYNLIKRIKPDIHVKGEDYKEKTMPEAKIVKSYGGKIVLLPLTTNISTTNIINKIKNSKVKQN